MAIPSSQKPSATDVLSNGRAIPSLGAIRPSTYVTAQLLVQQVAYVLSDKIFSYSPPSFDLDAAALSWASRPAGSANAHGLAPTVLPLQTRSGAGALALGYMFSPDFDLARRAVPQSLLAASLSLAHLRPSLDQLSLLYGVASPLVAHVAAADYAPLEGGLVPRYDTALRLAEDLGLALVGSAGSGRASEAQHMALLATALAAVLPTLHLYDGVRGAREALQADGAVLEAAQVADAYRAVEARARALTKRLDDAGKALAVLDALNAELGTRYRPFEYAGHAEPDVVVVAFGSVEAQAARQAAAALAAAGLRVGAVAVRLYRPFVEEAFIEALPKSARVIAVLGQVRDEAAVGDVAVQSALFADVFVATSFAADLTLNPPQVLDVKHAPGEDVGAHYVAALFKRLLGDKVDAAAVDGAALDEPSLNARRYVFWDVDDLSAGGLRAPRAVGGLLAGGVDMASAASLLEGFDNGLRGGAVRTDLTVMFPVTAKSPAVSQAPQQSGSPKDVVYVGDESLLLDDAAAAAVLDALAPSGGSVLLRLPGFLKAGGVASVVDAEKRIPPRARKTLCDKGARLFVLDPAAAAALPPSLEKDRPDLASVLVGLAFLAVARPDLWPEDLAPLGAGLDAAEFADVVAAGKTMCRLDVPAAWGESAADHADARPPPPPPTASKSAAFAPFDKAEPEPAPRLASWQVAAQALAFKEAFGTRTALRPDVAPVQTYSVTVAENRRLTPLKYDRNIFHIEFDLGDSGLTYNIGEALGIHGDNDPALVRDFIAFYGLSPDDVVLVPSREGGGLETRTVYQSLLQNLDILGKVPKRFYEALAEFATDAAERDSLLRLGAPAGAEEFKRRAEVDTVTYADVLAEFPSARPPFADLARLVAPLKRREYSIASAQAVSPTRVALMIVVVHWQDTKGRVRIGHATRFLRDLAPGTKVTVSVKPSVMKLPARDDAPLILAGLGTGLAPFRAFLQYRALQRSRGVAIGKVYLFLGSRHQREEYLYGEEWEAYLASGVLTKLGAAFSRDQARKIYIQDRMRDDMGALVQSYVRDQGAFYLCGPTWPVPDVTQVLQEAIARDARWRGAKVDPRKEIERLKDAGRYVLEVY